MTPYRARVFRTGQINALAALLDALKEERVPVRGTRSITTGLIEQYLDDCYLPLQPRTLLSVLREIEVPHDAQRRFLPWVLYEHQEPMQVLYERWMSERMAPPPPGFPMIGKPSARDEADQDAPDR